VARARRGEMGRRLAPLEAKGERTWFFFLCLALLNIVDSFNLNVVWPMLPFMVEGYGVARDPKDLGAWVGVAGAAVSVGQLISSYAWGALSDRIGRRPVMLLGMFNSTFSVLVFGTAKTYAQCVAGRFLSGLLNGNAGVVKTYVGETTEKSQQAAAFSVFAVAYGVASVVAPAVGGFLQRPAERWPTTFGGGLFEQFPYLLPMLCAATLTAVGGILGFLYVPETASQARRMRARRRDGRGGAHHRGQEDEGDARGDVEALIRLEDGETHGGMRKEVEMGPTRTPPGAGVGGPGGGSSGMKTDASADGTTDAPGEDDDTEDVRLLDEDAVAADSAATATAGDSATDSSTDSTSVAVASRTRRRGSPSPAGWDRHTVTAAASYAALASIAIGYDEIFPVYAKTSRELGGVGLSAREIGVVLIFGGVFLVIFQLTVFPRVLARLGVTGGLRIGSLVFSVAVLVAPCASLPGVVDSPAARWATLLSSQALKIATLAVLFTTVIMAVNNSCVNRVKARVNGAATTAAALTRIISPVVHGIIFSRSLRLPPSTPRQFVVFAFVGASSLALRGLVGRLPPRLDQPPREEDEGRR
jgi:MFS family permease